MIIVRHQINTVAELQAIGPEFGIEIDIRNNDRKLILHHDPWGEGEELDAFLSHYRHKLLILNVKTEGIEDRILELIKKYEIKDYFFLDVSFPFIVKMAGKGFVKNAVRFSEYESLETCLAMKGKCDWVWVDCFSRLPLTPEIYVRLKEHFKICLVSPDLLGRPAQIKEYRKMIGQMELDAVCADDWEAWQ
ncbi:MAG: hypothetical protein KKC80_05460 [Candidatus Margulisbacteria bacterium]|nr:hypothetical protein [Candidatus Margulisiibacteriota bacterium]MBU1617134.1 hypothetical protein [Candidatus Margulisiibacteriota bacterium]